MQVWNCCWFIGFVGGHVDYFRTWATWLLLLGLLQVFWALCGGFAKQKTVFRWQMGTAAFARLIPADSRIMGVLVPVPTLSIMCSKCLPHIFKAWETNMCSILIKIKSSR
jgi:hypothetical protein